VKHQRLTALLALLAVVVVVVVAFVLGGLPQTGTAPPDAGQPATSQPGTSQPAAPAAPAITNTSGLPEVRASELPDGARRIVAGKAGEKY
jgi:ribonuclease T1